MRFIHQNRHSCACAVRAVVNAKIWQCHPHYSQHTRIGMYEKLMDIWRIREGDAPNIGCIWRVCQVAEWPRVYQPTFRKVKSIINAGNAAIVTARAVQGDYVGQGHAMFLHGIGKGRVYGTGLYSDQSWDRFATFRKRWRLTGVFRVSRC